jgi:adenosylhomocysteinase
MEDYQVKDIKLAPQGHLQIEWAAKHMPVLNIIKQRFEKEKPLEGQTHAACLHVTKETAVLIKVLIAGGAKVALCGSYPLSTQDDVAAALADCGVMVYAWRGQNTRTIQNALKTFLELQTHHHHG